MKKMIALLLAAVVCVGLAACGGSEPTQEQLMIADAVNEVIGSEQFAQWQELYMQFEGRNPEEPAVANVTHYHIDDFEGEEMDCYLVDIAAGVAYWYDEAAEMGTKEENVYVFIDSDTGASFDNISAETAAFEGDISTEMGRMEYMLWMYQNIRTGSSEGNYINDSETVTEMSSADLKMISSLLAE